MSLGANTLENESSGGTKVSGPFRSGERKFQGANWPRSCWPIRSWERNNPGEKRV